MNPVDSLQIRYRGKQEQIRRVAPVVADPPWCDYYEKQPVWYSPHTIVMTFDVILKSELKLGYLYSPWHAIQNHLLLAFLAAFSFLWIVLNFRNTEEDNN